MLVEDGVAQAFEALHQRSQHGRFEQGAFDTITHLLQLASEGLKLNLDTTVLDVGSGPGYRTRRVFRDCDLTLLECSETALQQARDDRIEGSKVTLLQADYFDIPLEDGSVDLLVANGINEHYLDPVRQQLFEELYRIVRPCGGRMALIVPNGLNPFHALWKGIAEQRGTWSFGPQYDFTPAELYARMYHVGFDYLECFGVGAFTSWVRLFPKSLQRELVKNPTPSRRLNELLVNLDSTSTSRSNRYLGREVMVVGYKN